MDLKELLLGSRDTIAGTVSGTIVVLSVVTAGAPAFEHGSEALTLRDEVARRELAIPLAGVLPMTVVALGALGVLHTSTALWIAVGIGVATLTIEGIRYARLENLSRLGTLASVSLNLGFGLILVVLKATLSH